MTDPFHDWRNPAKPCMWSKGYHDNDHVVKIGDTIEHWDNGELTTKEMVVQLMNLYCQGYSLGLEDAHYQVPAIPIATDIGPNSIYQWVRYTFNPTNRDTLVVYR